LTYRCNNNCLHCWLWLSENSSRKRDELNFDEIQRIVSEARQMGCQAWAISGGEPMLREDFPEIFDFITRKAVHYTLNTNGSLITHQIARLLRRK
ncbi:MAG: radical SAM protein, partial [Aliifodinibius sp.]|nr:radical SAM protein [Fodinibius sp.]NIV13819.1 radical SAM protein [Fodinibius sp.]NIY27592.1 radical SAM protein [Fodinibius sp.]